MLKNCRVGKEVDPLLSDCQSLASLSSFYFLSFLNVNVDIDFLSLSWCLFLYWTLSNIARYCHFNVLSLTANEGTWNVVNIADN